MLFSAFEKHQYYNLKDLVDITKQPVVRTCSRGSGRRRQARVVCEYAHVHLR